MNRKRNHRAFTLVELLTVMAIIVVLISILTPALSTARAQARKTATRAQIQAIDVGLEAFHKDEGKYVPSNPNYYCNSPKNPTSGELDSWKVRFTPDLIQGAHLIVDAMVGRDFLGYDPRASGTLPRWANGRDRRQPYIPVDGVDVSSLEKPPEDAFGVIPKLDTAKADTSDLLLRVFQDKFGFPILYYRSSPIATQNTPIINTSAVGPMSPIGDGVYDGRDNELLTSYGGAHRIADANQSMNFGGGAVTMTNFAEFIRSIRATTYDSTNPTMITFPRPVKSDRFILLSPGRDGVYGNLDDVANFEVLSEQR